MVSIAVPQSGRARSAARHRERTEGRLPTRRPQTATPPSSSMNGTAGRATPVNTTAANNGHSVASSGSALVRHGNDTIRAAIRTQGRQVVPFFCECSDSRCEQALWIPLADYDECTRAGQAILVDGHAC
jgi:hypothetical protein